MQLCNVPYRHIAIDPWHGQHAIGMVSRRHASKSLHRYAHSIGRRRTYRNPLTLNLGLELLCNAVPMGALVLDSEFRVLFSNREGGDLLSRWHGRGTHRKHASTLVPAEIVSACAQLRSGRVAAKEERARPAFGGRIFLSHPTDPNLGAVAALERSPRDRRVAMFCVFLHDRLRDNLAAGRRDQLAMLTLAERRVAKLVAEGLRNREIAITLGKSVTTVKSQLSAVFGKLQVRSRTELATLLRSA